MKTIGKLALIFIFAASLWAQPFERPHGGSSEPKSHLRERISIIRIWKLVGVLDLTEEQSTVFFPAMNKHDADLERLRNDEDRLLDTLEAQLRSGVVDDATLEARIDSVVAIRRQRSSVDEEFFQKVADILNTEQKAKLLLFNRAFDKEMRNVIDMGVRGDKRRFMPDADKTR